ncbi:hypothetical protein ES332_A13G113900v1 [Gossypium tomentosum]|uniref:Uncharacterized protein n=1 Tax=Gossypium tomentosum TaxID=34277 RepID=A0A5D2MJF6_GOSTO|nr:hypothetical protein ES332_A13G113900v1 [Gossypium tomentosum]
MISPFILFLLPCRPTLLFSLSLSFFIFTFLHCAVQTRISSVDLVSLIDVVLAECFKALEGFSVMNLMSQINNDDRSRSHFCFVSKQCKLTCRFESENFVDVALFWLNP